MAIPPQLRSGMYSPSSFGGISGMFSPSAAVSRLSGGGGGGGQAMYVGDPSVGGGRYTMPTTLAGSPARAYDPAYGGIPGVPNPGASAGTAISTNLGNLSNLYRLAGGLDTASGAGAMGALGQEIPGVEGLIGSQVGNIGELQSGALPADVITQMRQQAAEIGAGQGMGPMSPGTNAGYLRALGLTSLGMKEKGAQELNALMGSVPRAPLFDPSSMLVSPQDEQQWGYLASMLAAAPEPRAAALENLRQLREGSGFGPSREPFFSFAPSGPRMPGTDALGFPEESMGGPSYPNLPILGAINPSEPSRGPAGSNLPPGMSYGGWQWDPNIGGYVNPQTGQISDTPGGTPWEGFSRGGVNAPAGYDQIQDAPPFGPMSDYGAMMGDMGYQSPEDFYGP